MFFSLGMFWFLRVFISIDESGIIIFFIIMVRGRNISWVLGLR